MAGELWGICEGWGGVLFLLVVEAAIQHSILTLCV
jgi:hypothetical protein